MRRPLFRHRYTAEERHRIVGTLFPSREEGWRFRFGFMLALSVVIAVMGISADSPAVVIGAMLIAPLMTPVMAFAAAAAMAWPRKMVSSAAVVVVASAGSALLAWVVATPLRDSSLTSEALLRTSPDFRDLALALAAGAAGAYATVDERVSTALPGVAVAVALVPPLATVGVELEAGHADLLTGALLLYVANLVAIVLAGIVVFLATGFVPLPRLARATPRVLAGVAAAVLATIAVAIPLGVRSIHAVERARTAEQVTTRVQDWLGTATDLELLAVGLDGARVTVEVAGSAEPPSVGPLVEALSADLGEEAVVEVHWTQRSRIDVEEPSADGAPGPTGAAQDVDEELRPLVRQWLDSTPEGTALEIEGIEQRDTAAGPELVVDVSGPSAPPPPEALADALADRLGRPTRVTVRWTERRDFATSPGHEQPDLTLEARVRSAAERWAAPFADLEVTGARVTDDAVTVDLAGPAAPDTVEGLVVAVQESLGSPFPVRVRFTERRVLTTTSTTSTTTTTAAATATSATAGATGAGP
ncbi:MAG: DUF389 domain-containing protein [Acidimicrobiia bacterium]|nr:DUF389 domain-containing protein [Acidimicrobiia bacterium]